jgi:hypothetical protein
MGCWPDCGGSAAPLAPSARLHTRPSHSTQRPFFTMGTIVATAAHTVVSAVVRHLNKESRMKKLALLVCLTAGLVLPAATAQAATTTEKIPFESTFEACGETITLTGTLIAILTEQPLPGGGSLITFHFQPQGVTGTSSSGAVYHGTGLTRGTTVQVPSGGLTDTFINRFHIVGTAGAPTYYVKETVHFTVSPTGEIRASVDFASEECV